MCDGLATVPVAVTDYGISTETLTKLVEVYRAGEWRTAPEAYAEKFAAPALAQPNPATLTMRVLDMFNDVAHRMGRHAPTSLWQEFGVMPDERHLILQLYLPRIGKWAERECTSGYVAAQFSPE